LLVIAIGLVLFGGISFARPLKATIPLTGAWYVGLHIRDGELFISTFHGDFNVSYIGKTPLDEYVDRQRTVPATGTGYTAVAIGDTTIIRQWTRKYSLWLPFFLVIIFLLATRRNLRHMWLAVGEVFRPSDRSLIRLFRRFVRRSMIASTSCVVLAVIALWCLSYVDLGPGRSHRLGNRVDVSTMERGFLIYFQEGQSYEFSSAIGISNGQIVILGSAQQFLAMSFRVNTKFTRIPCWLPVLVTSCWPVVAFVRGPFRRARRRDQGTCCRCGYNLTGLADPRCPECGTPTPGGIQTDDLLRNNVARCQHVVV